MKLLLEADRQHLDVDTSLSELREPELPKVLPLTSPIKVVDEQNEIVVCINDNGAAVQVFGSLRHRAESPSRDRLQFAHC
jgi:hypothetical protein